MPERESRPPDPSDACATHPSAVPERSCSASLSVDRVGLALGVIVARAIVRRRAEESGSG